MQVNTQSWKNYFSLHKEKLHGKQKYSSMHLHTPAVSSSGKKPLVLHSAGVQTATGASKNGSGKRKISCPFHESNSKPQMPSV